MKLKIIFKILIVAFIVFAMSLTACSCGGDTEPSDSGDGSGDGFGFFDDASDEETTEIDDLPAGVAILGTVNDDDVQVLDSEVSTSILKVYTNSGTGSGVIFSIQVTNESSSSDKILVNLYLSDATLIDSFTESTTYELNAADFEAAHLGSVRITTTDESVETYLIDSALLQFSEFSNEDGGSCSGIMQVYSDDSDTELTVDFSGTISIPTT